MKFMLIVWSALFARVKPVSTSAKPACMNMTRKPVTSSQVKLMPSRFWSTMAPSLTASGSFAWAAVRSSAVIVPGASPTRLEAELVVRPAGSPPPGVTGCTEHAASAMRMNAPSSPACPSRRSRARRPRPGGCVEDMA